MKSRLIGITGGIGAGKSALSRVFSEAGYPVLSADELAREVVLPGSRALKEISSVFGSKAIQPDGTLDRSWVRAEISRDSTLRKKLEAITHPRIQELSQKKAKELFSQGASLVFYEAPLLFEAGGAAKMDAIICVHAPDELRISRVKSRDGRSRQEIESLLSSQMPQEEKMRQSDFCVANDGTEEDLKARGLGVLKNLLGQ